MQHLCMNPEGTPISGDFSCMSNPGKVLRVSIPLSFNLATVLPRRTTYCVSDGTEGVDTSHTWWSSFTARTTGVSNPVRSPGFRTSASVASQDTAFAFGIPPDLYAFHHSTRNSMSL